MLTDKSAAFLIIGNEILSGRTVDANLSHLAKWLEQHGISLLEARVIPDQKDIIIQTVTDLGARYDFLFTSGGIGPTHDDITADCVAAALGLKIDYREDAVKILEKYYGKENINDARLRMARIPEGAQLILNSVSGAPGFYAENVYVMAGVPKIQRAMLEYLSGLFNKGPEILTASFIVNAPESALADIMSVTENAFEKVNVGSYPFIKEGVPGVNIVIRSSHPENFEQSQKMLQNMLAEKAFHFTLS